MNNLHTLFENSSKAAIKTLRPLGAMAVIATLILISHGVAGEKVVYAESIIRPTPISALENGKIGSAPIKTEIIARETGKIAITKDAYFNALPEAIDIVNKNHPNFTPSIEKMKKLANAESSNKLDAEIDVAYGVYQMSIPATIDALKKLPLVEIPINPDKNWLKSIQKDPIIATQLAVEYKAQINEQIEIFCKNKGYSPEQVNYLKDIGYATGRTKIKQFIDLHPSNKYFDHNIREFFGDAVVNYANKLR